MARILVSRRGRSALQGRVKSLKSARASAPVVVLATPMDRFWRLLRRWFSDCADTRASQIVELALSLPLLVLFVIGIFDFSSAITLKQKLTNAAREGARVAASDPAADLGTASFPVSVADAFYVVDRYLLSEKINDCGLFSSGPASSGILTWTATAASSGCTGTGLVLTIQRGNITPSTSGPTLDIISTVVTIQYPYTWQFSSISGLFGGFGLPTTIKTSATAFNEN